MKIKNMTLNQCKRIIDAGFVGEHSRTGKQVDYHDYRDEILAHYWKLSDRAILERSRYPRIDLNGQFDITVEVNRAFFKWRDIGFKCEMAIN